MCAAIEKMKMDSRIEGEIKEASDGRQQIFVLQNGAIFILSLPEKQI